MQTVNSAVNPRAINYIALIVSLCFSIKLVQLLTVLVWDQHLDELVSHLHKL
jgi:hypothetical protein